LVFTRWFLALGDAEDGDPLLLPDIIKAELARFLQTQSGIGADQRDPVEGVPDELRTWLGAPRGRLAAGERRGREQRTQILSLEHRSLVTCPHALSILLDQHSAGDVVAGGLAMGQRPFPEGGEVGEVPVHRH